MLFKDLSNHNLHVFSNQSYIYHFYKRRNVTSSLLQVYHSLIFLLIFLYPPSSIFHKMVLHSSFLFLSSIKSNSFIFHSLTIHFFYLSNHYKNRNSPFIWMFQRDKTNHAHISFQEFESLDKKISSFCTNQVLHWKFQAKHHNIFSW